MEDHFLQEDAFSLIVVECEMERQVAKCSFTSVSYLILIFLLNYFLTFHVVLMSFGCISCRINIHVLSEVPISGDLDALHI